MFSDAVAVQLEQAIVLLFGLYASSFDDILWSDVARKLYIESFLLKVLCHFKYCQLHILGDLTLLLIATQLKSFTINSSVSFRFTQRFFDGVETLLSPVI